MMSISDLRRTRKVTFGSRNKGGCFNARSFLWALRCVSCVQTVVLNGSIGLLSPWQLVGVNREAVYRKLED